MPSDNQKTPSSSLLYARRIQPDYLNHMCAGKQSLPSERKVQLLQSLPPSLQRRRLSKISLYLTQMRQNSAEACPSSAGTQQADITQSTSVCSCVCSETEEWHCLQPQAKYKLLLHGVYLAIYLLRVILIKTHNSLGEIAERAPENYRALSEVSQVSESQLSITGQGPSYCLTTHPRITARLFLIPPLSLPLGAPLQLGAGSMALQMPGPALQQHTPSTRVLL